MNEQDDLGTPEDNPLLDTLAALREIDGDYFQAHPDTVDDEVYRRMVHLWVTVAALAELHDRGEDADPESVRAEIARLAGEPMVFNPNLLLELEEGFRADGDELNANTLQQAAVWLATRFPAGSRSQN